MILLLIHIRPKIEDLQHWSYVLLFRTSMSEDAPVMSPAVYFSPRSPKLYNIVQDQYVRGCPRDVPCRELLPPQLQIHRRG